VIQRDLERIDMHGLMNGSTHDLYQCMIYTNAQLENQTVA